jgi:hypothetical protein
MKHFTHFGQQKFVSFYLNPYPHSSERLGMLKTSVVDPNSFFRIRIPNIFFPNSDSVLDSDPYTNILTRIYFKMVPLIAFICVLESVRQRKSFPTEKVTGTFFLSSVWSAIFHKKFYFTQCLDPNPNFFSDSDPAKIFGFGSTTLLKTVSKLL